MAAEAGVYWGLVAVRDDLEGSSNAPYGVSGSQMIPVHIHDLTTYQAFEVPIIFSNELPIADVEAAPNPVKVCTDVTLSVGPNCLDPDGTIVKYEYDYDYDGVNFTADATQDEGQPTFGQPVTMQYLASQAGNRTVAQRVTDDAADSAIDTVVVTVDPNQAPVAVLEDDDADNDVTVCDTVTFQPGVGTMDPDGVITKYEYDFDYVGGVFTADVTQDQGQPTFGLPVTKQFTNAGVSPIIYTIALRITDDGCPDLSHVATVVFTVRNITGVLLNENFETTAGGSVPTGWGITGHTGDAYYLNSYGSGCNDTMWRWGVTVNAGLCEGGESGFLNETGANHPNTDPNDTYQNRGCIVYTPEFTVPPNGATVTVRHNYDMCYGNLGSAQYLDGGRVIISMGNPGIIDWDDFCNTWESPPWNNNPLRPLSRISGQAFKTMSVYCEPAHPLAGMQADAGSSGGWVTSTYSIPNTYSCQKVRMGFLFASDDLLLHYLASPPASFYNDCLQNLGAPYNTYVFPGFGWRINWVQITAN